MNSNTLLFVETILVQKCHGRVYFVNTACFFSSRVTLNLFCAIFIALYSLLCRLCVLLFILNITQIGNSYFLFKFRNKATLGTTLFIYAQCFWQFIGTACGNVCECWPIIKLCLATVFYQNRCATRVMVPTFLDWQNSSTISIFLNVLLLSFNWKLDPF